MPFVPDQLRAYREFFTILANIKRQCLLEEASVTQGKEPAARQIHFQQTS